MKWAAGSLEAVAIVALSEPVSLSLKGKTMKDVTKNLASEYIDPLLKFILDDSVQGKAAAEVMKAVPSMGQPVSSTPVKGKEMKTKLTFKKIIQKLTLPVKRIQDWRRKPSRLEQLEAQVQELLKHRDANVDVLMGDMRDVESRLDDVEVVAESVDNRLETIEEYDLSEVLTQYDLDDYVNRMDVGEVVGEWMREEESDLTQRIQEGIEANIEDDVNRMALESVVDSIGTELGEYVPEAVATYLADTSWTVLPVAPVTA